MKQKTKKFIFELLKYLVGALAGYFTASCTGFPM